MKIRLSLFFSLFALVILSSCDDTETFDEIWKLDNEAQFSKISSNSEYSKLNSISGNGYIMYKVIEKGEGKNSPLYTDAVKVRYTGWYKNDWARPDKYTDDQGNFITNKKVFDTTSLSNVPRSFNVNGVVEGFSTALQYMKEGDIWEVWIPYYLGYGESSSGTIPAYTTLVFELELVKIVD